MAAGKLHLELIANSVVDSCTKGVPANVRDLRIRDIGRQGWNILSGALPLPVATLKQSALAHNSRWMQSFARWKNVEICPHGKSTMAPQLFQRQLDDGAWGITAATPGHVQVYRRFGVGRILLANQLVDRYGIQFVLQELKSDPDFDFYCLVDSVSGAECLAQAHRHFGLPRPLQVLVELGFAGGRTGVRSHVDGLEVARAVKARAPNLSLRGIECYEGLFFASAPEESVRQVDELLQHAQKLALACVTEGLFGAGRIILTAGGSSYFDRAADLLSGFSALPSTVVLRSGCYLTYDEGLYRRSMQHLVQRSPAIDRLGPPLKPALEIWGYVQSLPEPGLGIVGVGKRDISYDIEMPTPVAWYRPRLHDKPQPLDARCTVQRLNDQHAYLNLQGDEAFESGDMICLGISHPCTTFDKWKLLYLVDDDYNVLEGIATYF